ncbi:MCE-family protein MCE1A, partial [Mycobacterium avium subsp. hominissuis]|nr:MCE-family protein MCE1A [Mycobacterium avium subsp. hominissuis]
MQINSQRIPPYKLLAVAVLLVLALILVLIYGQFRGNFTPKTSLT